MREAMCRDLGVTGGPGVRLRSSQDADVLLRDFADPGEDAGA
ncbi:hypothetical protein PV963_19565 [Streptomyces coeruleorubidus]|nr:hypothetical protein [Streptomyces coeruleorubidus]WDV52415.1 hypothetical protein PV963_19565 [Streptomyces coeruleorubidus]